MLRFYLTRFSDDGRMPWPQNSSPNSFSTRDVENSLPRSCKTRENCRAERYFRDLAAFSSTKGLRLLIRLG